MALLHCRQILARCGATLALVLVPSAAALAAAGPKVTVRVEGKTRTLLAPTTVKTHTGFITKGGAPSGACQATSAAGALDTATHHHWGGAFDSTFNDYIINTILGDFEGGTKYFWSIFIDNRSATTLACGIKLHKGDQLLFAVLPFSGPTEYPIAIQAPSSAKVGQPFNVKVVSFNAKGKPKPLAGATLSVGGRSGSTDSHGVVPLTPSHAGTFLLRAEHAGYIRAAPVRLRVTA